MGKKKYNPSVKANNYEKEKLVQELHSIIFKLEKGKYNQKLDKATIDSLTKTVKSICEMIDDAIFTGEENIETISEKTRQSILTVKKALDGDLTNRVVDSIDTLSYYADSFIAISNGEIFTIEEDEEQKLSWSKKRLYERLDDLQSIKESFYEQEGRIENEIGRLEKDVVELDEKILVEENERMINNIYRKITATKSKLDMLNVRQNNYSACYNLLDIIYTNVNEILTASRFTTEEASKAKVLLDVNKLRNVINEPDKAIAILKQMDKDIKAMADTIKSIDEKVFELNTDTASVNQSALAYKEELMRRKREKEQNTSDIIELTIPKKTMKEIE